MIRAEFAVYIRAPDFAKLPAVFVFWLVIWTVVVSYGIVFDGGETFIFLEEFRRQLSFESFSKEPVH